MRSLRRALPAAVVAVAALVASAPAATTPRYFDNKLSNQVHELRDCLADLTPLDRRILVLRSGIGPRNPASPQFVAAHTGLAVAAVPAAQARALRHLATAADRKACVRNTSKGVAAKPKTKPKSKPVAAEPVASPVRTVAAAAPQARVHVSMKPSTP